MNFPARIPNWLKWIYPSLCWEMSTEEKSVYLTFDDGPHPTITPAVLAILAEYNAKATFFCIGDRVNRYPAIVDQILAEGHAIGNHTQHHVNGWRTSTEDYLSEIEQAAKLIPSSLFRPPYGRIKREQVKKILEKGYQIVMWTVLSADYDHSVSPKQCAQRVVKHIKEGDIFLFHDSEKGRENMLYALPKLLETATAQGFEFKKFKEVG